VLAALVISPVYGLLAGIIAALTFRFGRTHTVGIALISLGMLFLIAQQIRTGADPSFGWPSVFRRSHQPVFLGVVLLALAAWLKPVPTSDDAMSDDPMSDDAMSDDPVD
jgi:drug/metabolite transporter (DMT)-like permease